MQSFSDCYIQVKLNYRAKIYNVPRDGNFGRRIKSLLFVLIFSKLALYNVDIASAL